MRGSSPVRLHWRARQRDVDTGEGPPRYRRYLRDVLAFTRYFHHQYCIRVLLQLRPRGGRRRRVDGRTVHVRAVPLTVSLWVRG